jgi:hypothetical protein
MTRRDYDGLVRAFKGSGSRLCASGRDAGPSAGNQRPFLLLRP